jgi:Tol biopolymer transport system component
MLTGQRVSPQRTPVEPASLESVVRTCLEKEPDDRWQSARDLKNALALTVRAAGPGNQAAQASVTRRWIAVAAILLTVAVGLAALHFTERPPVLPVVRFSVSPPKGAFFAATTPRIALSPDGTQLAFAATTNGVAQLWVRRLDSLEIRPLPGTEGAEIPFWSPDSRSIGFFSEQKLKRVDVAGGPARILCDAPLNDGGGAWNTEGVILFSGRNPTMAIHRVSAEGGAAAPVTRFASGQTAHLWPRFLPDGRRFLYFAFEQSASDGAVYAGSLDGMEPKRILASATIAEYASGHLLYGSNEALMARPFDPADLEFSGQPVVVAPSVGTVANGRLGASPSANGVLAMGGQVGDVDQSQLIWMDRAGRVLGEVGAPAMYRNIRLSPDGKQLAMDLGPVMDIWLLDLARSVPLRLTLNDWFDLRPVWSPDGNHLVYASTHEGARQIYRKAASGLEPEELLLKSDTALTPSDWSPDGKEILVEKGGSLRDLYLLSLAGRKEVPVQATPADEIQGRFSPDGRWIAFVSNESGILEVFVRSFPGNERKIPISKNGGLQPQWRRDGRELYFIDFSGKLMAVPIKLTGAVEAGIPVPLFQTGVIGITGRIGTVAASYAVSGDGAKFLLVRPEAQVEENPIAVIQNWMSALSR